MGVGCFGTDIGDVNILGGRGALGRDWGCKYCEEAGFGVEIGEINI